MCSYMVRVAGLEPACIAAADFKSAVYTIPPHPQNQFVLLMNMQQLTLSFAVYVVIILYFCQCVKWFS